MDKLITNNFILIIELGKKQIHTLLLMIMVTGNLHGKMTLKTVWINTLKMLVQILLLREICHHLKIVRMVGCIWMIPLPVKKYIPREPFLGGMRKEVRL